MKLEISDWKTVPYAEAWDRQTAYFDALVHAKQAGEEYVNRIVLCEHPHVYTLGRSGKETNMLLGEEQLRAIGASLYHIDRGGDITYHGPGQLVCYPILNLEEFSLGLKEYVHLLEEAVIRVCASYGITAGRVEKATGVWLDGDSPRARKICAIGVRSSHYVTMHDITYRSGLFFPTIVTIPLCKVQQVSIQQNPISKIFGLYSIAIVNGAQFEAETVIPGLTKARADEMKIIIMEYIQHGTI